jgi:serine/threonine protein kinase
VGEVGTIAIILGILLVGVPALVVVLIFVAKPLWRGIAWVVVHVARFVGREIADVLRIFGALLTSIALTPIAGMNAVLGRWESARHYGRAIKAEMMALCGCVYRVLIGNPARLLMLSALTEGLETRIPDAIAHAPSGATARAQQFEGYTIVGTLPGGGSGAKLYVADPGARKLAAFARDGQQGVGRVVVKAFSLSDGSTLPQIVRENRSLPAAKRLGLILEHELTEEKFYYVTRYVPGESLVGVTGRLHAMGGGGPEGLGDGARLREAVGYASDILRTLSRYHSGGLWHKDVKPDNIIVHEGKAELVDFGLVTPLRSSMTLTTHGTEYFRDPEMVRMALRGVKVHEVDGAKFDIYAAGAVLYSMIENSFPAHGGLSRIGKKCPESLRWVVRRAMTDYDKRYETAAAMLGDVETVLGAPDPFALRPADLPSVRLDRERGVEPSSRVLPIPSPDMDEVGGPRVGPAVHGIGVNSAPEFPHPMAVERASAMTGARGGFVGVSVLRVVNWWSGKYSIEPEPLGSAPGFDAAVSLGDARERAKAARKGVPVRLRKRGAGGRPAPGLSTGARIAMAVGVVAIIVNLGLMSRSGSKPSQLARAVSAMRQTFGLRTFSTAIGAGDGGMVVGMGRALILSDASDLDPQSLRQVNERLDRLAKSGFEIVGTTTAAENTKKAAAEAEEIEGLRSEIGRRAFRSEEAASAVRGWLAGRSDLTVVVWIRSDAAKKADAWIVGRADARPEQVRAAVRAFTP